MREKVDVDWIDNAFFNKMGKREVKIQKGGIFSKNYLIFPLVITRPIDGSESVD